MEAVTWVTPLIATVLIYFFAANISHDRDGGKYIDEWMSGAFFVSAITWIWWYLA